MHVAAEGGQKEGGVYLGGGGEDAGANAHPIEGGGKKKSPSKRNKEQLNL